MLGLSPTKGLLRRAAVKKQKKRKNYAFRRQFNEKPSIIPGCPGAVKKRQIVDGVTYLTKLQLLIMLGLQPVCMCLCGGVSLLGQAKCMVEAVCFQLLSVQGCVMLHFQLLPESILQHRSLCDTRMHPLPTPLLT